MSKTWQIRRKSFEVERKKGNQKRRGEVRTEVDGGKTKKSSRIGYEVEKRRQERRAEVEKKKSGGSSCEQK